ncbi:MAG: tRNA (cytidine(34)-2'-O)-methyltransferase [Alphaproteobacteria bacterium]|nr:tRNA (cytidine(34)-2'-O)-methyltransferase [Alphaproteobacteria bacterium]
MRITLYQPDIPQNTGTIMRLAACLGVGVDIIEPCGFVWSDRHLRRAGMDYLDRLAPVRHASWEAFQQSRRATGERLILLTTKGSIPHTQFTFEAGDRLLLGRESAGVPDEVHEAADARVRIPMIAGLRSVNVAMVAAMVLGEALRQINGFPEETNRDG